MMIEFLFKNKEKVFEHLIKNNSQVKVQQEALDENIIYQAFEQYRLKKEEEESPDMAPLDELYDTLQI